MRLSVLDDPLKAEQTIDWLTSSSNPSVQYKARLNILGEDEDSVKMEKLRSSIRSSELIGRLLSERGKDGRIPAHPYGKWYGSHWILADLADQYYPTGDKSLLPLREQEYEWLFSESHLETAPFKELQRRASFPADRPRIHASMEGNAVFSLLRLGLNDDKTDELADRLLETQWPDGGWNCDRRPMPANPTVSSFHETITPLRALALHARIRKSGRSPDAAKRAAEVFLKRGLYKRLKNGRVMDPSFVKLHYPAYWHFDVLMGLKVMAEAGFIRDKRCNDALDLLESRQLKTGGFAAEAKFYQTNRKRRTGLSLTDWGGVSSGRLNEFVTVDALSLLRAAGRI